jgi:hypothetical protein
MKISHERYTTLEAGIMAERERLQTLPDADLIAQELVQKGALHAIETLLRWGVTHSQAEAMKESLTAYASAISEECVRRKLPIVDHPGAN